MMGVYREEAVVIKRIDFDEASKIVTFYTRYHGKVGAVARGVRRMTSRKGGTLEQFSHVRVALAKGRNLDVVCEAEVVRSFAGMSRRLDRAVEAYRMCELVDRLTPELEKNPEVFRLLLAGLERLDSKEADLAFLRRSFQLRLLRLLGYWPAAKSIRDERVRAFARELLTAPFGRERGRAGVPARIWSELDALLSEYTLGVTARGLNTDKTLSFWR
jgi:recombinational DNA repair protein (RecF pathway)